MNINLDTPQAISRKQFYIGLLLALLMAATRSHHFAGIDQLPDASWAAFFIAGIYLNRTRSFLLLAALATVIDWIAISWGSVSSFCITPAYAMLLPAYAALWLGGCWYARRHRETWATLPRLGVAVMSSALIAELFSSGGFYFFGGRFVNPTLVEFLPRLVKYFPPMLGAMTLYVVLAALLHILMVNFSASHSARQS